MEARKRRIPSSVIDKYDDYISKGDKCPGTPNPKRFKNNEGKLPKKDKDGNDIEYTEYDVNAKREGQTRDTERVVTGSDGNSYYTNDHYQTFKKIPERTYK